MLTVTGELYLVVGTCGVGGLVGVETQQAL